MGSAGKSAEYGLDKTATHQSHSGIIFFEAEEGPVRILVTNDDGVDAPGLTALAQALGAAGHHIEIAVPASDRSGTGSGVGSIEHGTEVAFDQRELPGLPGVPVHVVDAPPSFAVLAGCTGVLGPRPELVVSGINDGFNTGRFLLASSTVGAALAAGSLGVRGLAISAGFAPDHRFDTAARIAVEAVGWMIESSRPRTVLNINVPDLGIDEVRGVRMASLAPRGLMGLRVSRGDRVLRMERYVNTEGLGVDTDAALVHDGYVSVSVLPSISDPGRLRDAPSPAEHLDRALSVRGADSTVTTW